MKKQQDEIMAIMKMREAASSGTQVHGDLTWGTLHMGPAPASPGGAGWWDSPFPWELQVEVLSPCPAASWGLHLHRVPGGEEDGGRAAREGEWWAQGTGTPGVCPRLRGGTGTCAEGLPLRCEGGTAPDTWKLVPSSQIPATMTAEELTFEILDRRKVVMKEKDYWSCYEVNEREEAGWWGGD